MILDEIVEAKKEELAERKRDIPLSELQAPSSKKDFAAALRGEGIKLIAEVKKASPSRGLLCPDFDPLRLAQTYADNGAAAISVLTEEKYFQGSLEHLAAIKEMLNQRDVPLLRKDFIFDPYQVYERVWCRCPAPYSGYSEQ
jgi:indole-3-glycerol phosphate synthase